MLRLKLMTAASMLALAGCGTYSFAPPEVSLSRRVSGQNLSQDCLISPTAVAAERSDIGHNVDGALDLVENFIDSYRCTMRLAADGRQAWQLPGFLALAGSAAASAFGGGTDWGIAGGAASAMFNAGNAYYNPAEQAAILRDAIGALTCIQTEAVGVSAFSRVPTAAPAVANANVEAAERGALAADSHTQGALMELQRATTEVEAREGDVAMAAQRFNQMSSQIAPQSLSPPDGQAADRAAPQAQSPQVTAQLEITRAQGRAAAARQAAQQAQDALLAAQAAAAPAWARLAEAQAQAALSEIEITPERQYYNLVAAALLGVEISAAQRLSRRGTYNAEGVRAQIAALTNQAEKAQNLVTNPPPAPPPPPPLPPPPGGGAAPAQAVHFDAALAAATARVQRIQLRLDAMQPKLQQCILRAQV